MRKRKTSSAVIQREARATQRGGAAETVAGALCHAVRSAGSFTKGDQVPTLRDPVDRSRKAMGGGAGGSEGAVAGAFRTENLCAGRTYQPAYLAALRRSTYQGMEAPAAGQRAWLLAAVGSR